ncbi:MAG: hypothetical protein LRS48_02010 [Desulfurococcales archaeon]|nr:hypothetical protein [Desulfurococcales archaeon]
MSRNADKEEEILKYIVEIVSSTLEDLLELDRQLISASARARASPESEESSALLAGLLASGSQARMKLIELVNKAISIVSSDSLNSIPRDVLDDLLALSGYYAMGGYKTDLNAISTASSVVDTERSVRLVNLLKSDFQRLYNILNKKLS